MHISLINDFKQETPVNSKNKRGRYVCPITYDILTINNTIKIGNVLYSAKGLCEWTKHSISQQYEDLVDLCQNQNCTVDNILENIIIRSPITNIPFEYSVVILLYKLFIQQYDKNVIESICLFIKKTCD
jgi:hypothetical protein